MNKMKKVAWIEIWNYKTELCIQTIKESCDNEEEGYLQLQILHQRINSWTSQSDGIILKTQNLGTIRIPAQFIHESIITIVFGMVDDFDDVIEDESNE